MRKLDFLWMSNDDWIIQRENGTFTITNPENYSGLYLPLAGENDSDLFCYLLQD